MRLKHVRLNACLLCRAPDPTSWEHLFPESMGGKIEAQILCEKCNNAVSGKLVAGLTQDPAVRIAMEQLREELPKLYEQMSTRWLFAATGIPGSLARVRVADGRARILPGRGPNDSVIIDSDDAPEKIRQILERQKVDEHEIGRKLSELEALEDFKPMDLPGDWYVAGKGPLVEAFVELRGPVDERVAVLTALEFLCLVVGKKVMDPYFDPVREYIRGSDLPLNITVERLGAAKPGPFHSVRFLKTSDQDLRVQVAYFRFLAFEVTFRGAYYRGRLPVVIGDLLGARTMLALTYDDAMQGNYYQFGGDQKAEGLG